MKDIFNEVIELEKFVFNSENTGEIVLDKAYDLSVKKELLAEQFEKILEENKVDGFFVTQDNGYHISVTKSAKEQDKWQVTNFDSKMIPISDNGNQNIKDASESFFNSFTLSSLDKDSLDKLQDIYKDENNLSLSAPQPLPVNDFDNFCTNPEINKTMNKHLNLTDENKERRFFIDEQDALKFYQANFKEIEKTLEMQANACGYSSKTDFMKDSPYFNKFEKEDLEKAFTDRDNKELNNLYIELSNYTADTLNFDKEYFENSQNNVLEDYSNGELYIFLSDESSQAVYVKDNMFMDDQDSEISGKLNQVFDQVEQVETLLEANEALIQDKINRINLMDNRKNPNINTIKSIAQGKLNHIKSELSEIKPFNNQTLTPIGHDKENIIMVDLKNDNLYSISKDKIIASEKDIADILKNNKPIELFNNGDKIEIKGYSDNVKEKSKELKNSMEIN